MQEARIAVGDDRLRLPVGTLLDGVYEIEGEIGAGGFGITYVARDRALGFKVAIKEYFPAEVGSRDSTMSVQPTTNGQKRVFDWGRSGFLNEARMLATLSHPNIVRVLRFFEANNTAYMVLEFEQGTSFAKWLDSLGRPPTQAELDRIARPLVEAIGAIHARKLVHRDIAPDNIIIRPDGSPVLLDFGAARHDVAEATRAAQSPQHSGTFAVIKRHYSPIEQHSTDTRNRGAWSDVYAVGGTFYRAVTGRAPTDAQDRLAADADPLVPARKAARGDYRLTFLDAIDEALRLKRHARPQSMPALAQMMFGEAAVSPHDRPPAKGGAASGSGKDEAEVPTVTFGKYPSADLPPAVGKRPSQLWPVLVAALALVIGGGTIWWRLAASTEDQRLAEQRIANAEAQNRRNAEAAAEARRRADEETRLRQAAEARARAEAEARQQAEIAARQAAEAQARAEAEARQRAEIAARQAEDARRRADDERKRLAAEDVRRKEDEQRKAEEARKRATAERTPAPRTFEGFDAQGGDIGSARRNVDRSDCEAACRSEPRCVAYSYDSWNRYCHVKHTVGQLVRNARATLVVRDGATAITFSTAEVTFERWSGHDFPTGKLIEERHTLGIDACEGHCRDNAQCVAFTYVRTPGRCRLFSSTGVYEKNSEADSRAKRQLAP